MKEREQQDDGCQTKCCVVRDEVGLLKLKLGVLAVLCLILGAFAVTFKVLYINGNLTKEQEKWNRERKNMTDQLSETQLKLSETEETYRNLSELKMKLGKDLEEINGNVIKELETWNVGKENMMDQLSETQRKLNETVESYKILSKEKTTLEKELEVLNRGCAADWKYHSGKSYYFSSDRKSWTESRDFCVSVGGHLIIINSDEEWSFLIEQVKASNPNEEITEEIYWIGLTDSVTEGDWRWLDNTPLSSTPKFWHGNEPDNWTGNNKEYPDGEDCAKMHVTPTVYGFYDSLCEDKFKQVCEAIAVK